MLNRSRIDASIDIIVDIINDGGYKLRLALHDNCNRHGNGLS